MTKQKTILFLEDEVELLTALSNLLRDQGYNVIQAERAEEAITDVEQSPPDLILADIKLPGLDGFDFFREMRKKESSSTIPFVFLTAFNNLAARAYAKEHGAADFITKPFDFEYLIARIRQLLPPV